MPLYTYGGSLLRVDGVLAANAACCCEAGACCTDYFGCIDGLTPEECALFVNSNFQAGTTCDSDPCDCTNATVLCCVSGVTITTTDCNCTLFGGKTITNSSECLSIDCSTYGSCCWPDGQCLDDVAKCVCEQTNGSFSEDECSTRNCIDQTDQFDDDECVLCTVTYLETYNQSGPTICQTTQACSDSGGSCAGVGCDATDNAPMSGIFSCTGSPTCITCGPGPLSGNRYCRQPATNCIGVIRSQTQSLTSWANCKAARGTFGTGNILPFTDNCTGVTYYNQYLYGQITSASKACATPSCTPVTATANTYTLVACSGGCSGTDISTPAPSTTTLSCTSCNGCT